jgi:hypothetical protein
MIFVAILFIVAISLSAVAAYYSIVGLTAIFAAAAIPVAVMGGTLEVTKLVTASWLYRNWKTGPTLLKAYFISAVMILMLITSLGIFGYLSKAHVEQAIPLGDVSQSISLIDSRIAIEQSRIDANKKTLQQMDATVDEIMSRSTNEAGAAKSLQVRRSQQKDRNRILDEIEVAQKKILELNTEKAPLAAKIRNIEAEVGPIKYIASFVYGNTDQALIERAVTWMIILIIVVFDPLAVLLLIAANHSLSQLRQSKVASIKIDMETPEPVEMSKEDMENATRIYHRDQYSN